MSHMNSVLSRFFLNLPHEEFSSSERIFVQLEQAYWFYEDFYCDHNADLERFTEKEFCHRVFSLVTALQPYLSRFEELYADFQKYLAGVPVCGCILLNEALTHCVVVRSWEGKTYTFPRGKINKAENQLDCAIRETYEETGFDSKELIAAMGNRPPRIETKIRNKNVVFFVVHGVSQNTVLAPRCRKEISEVKFVPITDIANTKKFWSISPLLPRLNATIRTLSRTQTTPGKQTKTRSAKTPNIKTKTSSGKTTVVPAVRAATDPTPRSKQRSKQQSQKKSNWATIDQATFGSPNRRWSAQEMFKIHEQNFGTQPQPVRESKKTLSQAFVVKKKGRQRNGRHNQRDPMQATGNSSDGEKRRTGLGAFRFDRASIMESLLVN